MVGDGIGTRRTEVGLDALRLWRMCVAQSSCLETLRETEREREQELGQVCLEHVTCGPAPRIITIQAPATYFNANGYAGCRPLARLLSRRADFSDPRAQLTCCNSCTDLIALVSSLARRVLASRAQSFSHRLWPSRTLF